MPGDRLQRVAEEIRKEVAQILQTELKDPRIGGFVTITHVRVTPDLRQATVYFSLLDPKKSATETEAGLQSARGFVRKLIGERIRIKFNPEIAFKHDPSLAESIRISKLLGGFKTNENEQ
jgi:ribosome-binding factor A